MPASYCSWRRLKSCGRLRNSGSARNSWQLEATPNLRSMRHCRPWRSERCFVKSHSVFRRSSLRFRTVRPARSWTTWIGNVLIWHSISTAVRFAPCFEERHIGAVPQGIFVAVGHPLLGIQPVKRRDLVRYRQLLMHADDYKTPAYSHNVWRSDSFQSIAEMVADDLGWAALPLNIAMLAQHSSLCERLSARRSHCRFCRCE